mmetsp:Transcript_5530/g.20139  ORF Transcript_5530/g.20139 Transcript_5530/m.20139 type:complete len:312 (-) Transcript_5530:52-987(-)
MELLHLAFGVLLGAVLLSPRVALVVLRHALFNVRGRQVQLGTQRLVIKLRHIHVVVFNRHAVLKRLRHRLGQQPILTLDFGFGLELRGLGVRHAKRHSGEFLLLTLTFSLLFRRFLLAFCLLTSDVRHLLTERRVRVDLARDGVQALRRVLPAGIFTKASVRATLRLQHLQHVVRRKIVRLGNLLNLRQERAETERQHQPRHAFDGPEQRPRQPVARHRLAQQRQSNHGHSRRGNNRGNLIRQLVVLRDRVLGLELGANDHVRARSARRSARDARAARHARAFGRAHRGAHRQRRGHDRGVRVRGRENARP